MSRVVLAMSGGVDSSVAASLLLDAGHEVYGVFMRHGEQSPVACNIPGATVAPNPLPILSGRLDHKQGCCSASDAEDARRVADRLGIPFFALDLQEEFSQIMDYFSDEYLAGRTPNPCVVCNQQIKFGKLFDYANALNAENVATGHYARIGTVNDSPALLRGVDRSKDQAYALFGVEREYLARMLLPIGGFEKTRIREIAASIGLNVAEKKDSQEICFVVTGRHEEFIRARREEAGQPGEIVTTQGTVVGSHEGVEAFTIGQRKGLGVAMGEPYFVVRIEHESRRVVIGRHEELARLSLEARKVNWLVDLPTSPRACVAKIRYNGEPTPATVTPLENDRLRVEFESPRHGVAPGQAVVCFDGDQVLCGGWIE